MPSLKTSGRFSRSRSSTFCKERRLTTPSKSASGTGGRSKRLCKAFLFVARSASVFTLKGEAMRGSVTVFQTDMSRASCRKPVDHRLGNQADSLLCAVKSFGVAFGILSHYQSFWNPHTSVDHHILQSCSTSHLGIRQDHCIFDSGIRMNVHAGEQQGTPYRSARNNASSRD